MALTVVCAASACGVGERPDVAGAAPESPAPLVPHAGMVDTATTVTASVSVPTAADAPGGPNTPSIRSDPSDPDVIDAGGSAAPPEVTDADAPSTTTRRSPTTAPAQSRLTDAASDTTEPTRRDPVVAATPHLDAVIARLASQNLAVSISVWHDGRPVYQRAAGRRVDGQPITTSSPFVQASVSKLITALTVVRLARSGLVDLDTAPPWSAMGLPHHPEWDTVTVHELMAHEGGLPSAPDMWFDERGSCAQPLVALLAQPPTARRGEWTYSNGNYCALGLLTEFVTGERYDGAARRLVLAPAGVDDGHLTVDGSRPDDAPYPLGVGRLDRLGAAGQWLLSTDAVAAALSSTTRGDLRALRPPAIFRDMLGWGHTGTVDGAKSCAWVLQDGRTVVAAALAGNRPERGSLLCAEVIPAVVVDLTADHPRQ